MAHRLSLGRGHTEAGIIAELITLLETITADGTITDPEVHEISAWLNENDGSTSIPGMEFLRTTVREILADGRVTAEERKVLYKAVEKILPVEARRRARERRTAMEDLNKAQAREERETQKKRVREERVRDRPVMGANFMVAGVLYEGRARIVERFVVAGQRVFLVREPQNPNDPNAILVRLHNGFDIGYVPRDEAGALAKFLDIGLPYDAVITKILQGRRAPIPVVDADIFNRDATHEKFFPADAPQAAKSPQPRSGCAAVFGILTLVALALLLAVFKVVI